MEQTEEEEIREASRKFMTQDNICEQQKRKGWSWAIYWGAGSRKQGGRPSKTRKLELIGENWGLETTPSQSRAPPPGSSLPKREAPPEPTYPPGAPPELSPGGKPDDSSLLMERVVKGLPPMQVASSVEHLYEGHLGEVTKGWGSDLTSPPNPPPPPI